MNDVAADADGAVKVSKLVKRYGTCAARLFVSTCINLSAAYGGLEKR